jgi:ribosome biogenesis GTPase
VPHLTDVAALTAIGWNARLAAALAALPDADGRPARVIEQHRAHLLVDDGRAPLKAKPLPTLFGSMDRDSDGLVVGDWVMVREEGGTPFIHACLPRTTLLQRSRPEHGMQRIAANVDTALLVMALDNDYSPNRLERYLLMVRAADVVPVIVLTKPDRAPDLAAQQAEIAALAGAGVPVQVLDAREPDCAERLAPWLAAGETLVLLGSSGVGKSTLVNTLVGGTAERTGATRAYDDRGRHTTTARSLRRLLHGACLIDTPGVRELRLGGDEDVARDAFDDIARHAADCRFRDCRHEREPGCAVVMNTAPERLASYRKLSGELAATAKRLAEAPRPPKRR